MYDEKRKTSNQTCRWAICGKKSTIIQENREIVHGHGLEDVILLRHQFSPT